MTPRVAGLLVGDIAREPGARVKYGFLFDALARHFELGGVGDVTPRGLDRWVAALAAAHPDRRVWRERFYKNQPAFLGRSRRAAAFVRSLAETPDAVLQISTLFDASHGRTGVPNVIYTDYTARLSARRPDLGRSPFSASGRKAWIEQERRTLTAAAHVLARSWVARDSLVKDHGLSPERVAVVGGGVNMRDMPALAERDGSSAPLALFIGKDFQRKGGDVLLHAFGEARTHAPGARLILVAEGPVPGNLPLAGVEVVAPTWDREAIFGLYRRADLFVLPSRLETWGDVLLEAMAFGLPCVGVKGQAMEEIILDGATGLLVPSEDPRALAEALVALFQRADMRREWGRAGRRRVEAEFTWDRVVERLAPALIAAAEPKPLGAVPQARTLRMEGA